MIIKRLKLENWKTFDDVEFTFTQGLNIIEGSNYSGKTAFIQALYFALFNETLYKQLTTKDLKKEGEKDASVVFDFTVDGQEYRIRRNISGERVIKTGSYIYRLENGDEVEELESISRKGQKLTNIEDLLKASSRFVKNINFIQEESIPQLLNNPKTKILEDIYKILQLDLFTQINDYCTKSTKTTEKRVKKLENQYNKALETSEKLKEKIKGIDNEIKNLKVNEENVNMKISESEKKLDKFSELNNLIVKKEKLTSRLNTIIDKKNYISNDLEINKEELKDLEELEKELGALKKKSEIYLRNEKNLKELQKERQRISARLSLAKQSDLLLEDKKSQLTHLQQELDQLQKAQEKLEAIKPKLKPLEMQLSKYNSFRYDLNNVISKIEHETKIIENFKKGVCPITEDNCPISENFIDKYTISLDKLKKKKQSIEEQFIQLKNPEKEYYNLLKQKDQFKNVFEDIDKVKLKIKNIKNEIDTFSQTEKDKKQFEIDLGEIDKKINLIQDSIKNLQKFHEDFISKKEKIKEKEKLLSKINNKESKIKKFDSQILEIEDKIKINEKNIEEFKNSHKITDISELDMESTLYDDLKNQLADIKLKIKNNAFKIDQIEKERISFIEPYNSLQELHSDIEKLVHREYKIIFFQEALNMTLDELKTRKLKSIQDICNKMWRKFRLDSGRHMIDWDENFLPVLKIGGIERNLYQLSSSEKMFIYFSIRAALLAELGPNYFIVVDNLLTPFMVDNQKVVIDQIKRIIDETSIKQIIFTGFDISPDVKCDNHIKLEM